MLDKIITDKIDSAISELDQYKEKDRSSIKTKTEVLSSDSYKSVLDSEDRREFVHTFVASTAALAIYALQAKLIKSKQTRQLIRKFLSNPYVAPIRNKLFRPANENVSPGFLRIPNGKQKIVRNIIRQRMIKSQITSTGLSLKEAGFNKRTILSENLKTLSNFSAYVEEFSPMKIGRTLSASHIFHSLRLSNDMPTYHIDPHNLNNLYSYYEDMASKIGSRTLNAYDLNFGLFYNNGKIYGGQKDLNNKIVPNFKDKVFDGAIPVLTETDLSHNGLDKNTNQIFRKYLIEQGVSTKILDSFNSNTSVNKVSFILGRHKYDAYKNYIGGYISKMFESGARALDGPLSLPSEYFEDKIRNINNQTTKANISHIYNIIMPRLGSGTLSSNGGSLIYDRQLKYQIKDVFKNIFLKGGTLIGGGMVVNEALSKTFGDEYRLDSIAADAFVNSHLLYSKIFSNETFQKIKEKQEELMPGSTGIFPILGTIGGLGMIGAISSYGYNTTRKITKGMVNESLLNKNEPLNIKPLLNLTNKISPQISSSIEGKFNSIISSLSKNRFIGNFVSSEHSRTTRWALAGAAIGTALSIPMMPSMFVGKSYEELKAEYSGEKDIAIRANRFWSFGGESFQGGKIKYFDKSWYFKLKNRIKDKTLYGSTEEAQDYNPILHPFKYLNDPYKYEREHQEDRPFPVWGMDITYGSFFGEAIEATIGRIIKPTVYNPELEKYGEGSLKDGTFRLKKTVSEEEAELIQEGKLLDPINPERNTVDNSINKTISGGLDFSGFKGFIMDTLLKSTSYKSPIENNPSYQVSGSSMTLAKSIKEANIGDIGILGESQRRIVNTSADLFAGRVENPLLNKSPSWLPGKDSNYYIDFSSGDYYSKVENATSRLPGKGYAIHERHLKDINPEDYPIINKYDILSDVALGSKEYYIAKREIEEKEKRGTLNDYEKRKLSEIRDQVEQRSKEKIFTDSYIENKETSNSIFSKYWNFVSSIAESPIEELTPLRPGSKLIHNRTAIEDYKKTVLFGNDMALWSNPIKDFSQSTAYQLGEIFGNNDIPEHEIKKRLIDEYFDKLEFVKQREIYKNEKSLGNEDEALVAKNNYLKTKIGALTIPATSKTSALKLYNSLSDEQKDYFNEFGFEKDKDKREEILETVSSDEGKIYTKLWNSLDKLEGIDTYDKLSKYKIEEESKEYSELEKADIEAKDFISKTFGMPSENFSGWDKRIEIKDIKLRFLQLSGEDIHDYGYWHNDEYEMLRKVAILRDKNFLDRKSKIDNSIDYYKEKTNIEINTRKSMLINNIKAKEVEVRTGNGSIEFIQ